MSLNRVLLVDDNEGQRITLESILKQSGFDVTTADCGTAALSATETNQFAAVLLDIKLPDLTGLEVLKVIKERQPETRVIMMTGYSQADYAINALNSGATAFLIKPANIELIKRHLTQALEYHQLLEENKAMSAALREWNQELERKVAARTKQLREANKVTLTFYEELKKNFDSTLEVLSIAIDQRDPLTSSHSFRVTQFALEIGKHLKITPEEENKLRYAGLMHDLGKIEIKQSILCKEGSLTADEYKEIQTHAHGTYELLSKFKLKRNLEDVPLIASSHHERFDGTGYPRKLKGDEIPFLSRVLAVADVLDAITSKRHYRTAMSVKDALSILKREAGGHFDPRCVDAAFEMSSAEFIKIHLVEHLERLDATDLFDLAPISLNEIYLLSQADEFSNQDLKIMGQFYHYYQGPLPPKLQDKIKLSADFTEEAA